MGISMQDAISTAPACVGRTFGNWQQWRDATMPKDTEPSTVMASRSDADPDDADGSARLAMTGLRRELEQRAKQLETVTAALQQAEQRERSRLARILHDHLQQLIVAAQLAVAQAEQRLGLDEAVLRTDLRPLLGRADDLLRQSLTATRDLMAELDPPVLHAKDFAEALAWLAQLARERYGLSVTLDTDGPASPQRLEIRSVVFNSVREAVFNSVKHSGCSEVRIDAGVEQGRLRVIVADQGAGFDPEQLAERPSNGAGHGIRTMRQRLEAFGGRLEIDSRPGAGTRIIIEAPL
jgi:signal transduction histidine kinase